MAQAGFDVVWLDLEGAPEERLGLAQLPAWRCDAERHAGRQIGGSYAALNARCGVRFTLAAAQEQHLGVRGKDFARAREVQVIVLFDMLHPRSGRRIPLAHHGVPSRRRGVSAARLDVIEHHAGDVPVHGVLAEIDVASIGDLQPKPLRTGQW